MSWGMLFWPGCGAVSIYFTSTTFKLAESYFRPLEIHQNSNGHSHLVCYVADSLYAGTMLGLSPVRSVQPQDLGTCLQNPAQGLRRIRCRSERGNDLSASHGFAVHRAAPQQLRLRGALSAARGSEQGNSPSEVAQENYHLIT